MIFNTLCLTNLWTNFCDNLRTTEILNKSKLMNSFHHAIEVFLFNIISLISQSRHGGGGQEEAPGGHLDSQVPGGRQQHGEQDFDKMTD